jgi:hypothetical protein
MPRKVTGLADTAVVVVEVDVAAALMIAFSFTLRSEE